MTDIRNEIQNSYFMTEDQNEGIRKEIDSKSERHSSKHQIITRDSIGTKINKTARKTSKKCGKRKKYEDDNQPQNKSEIQHKKSEKTAQNRELRKRKEKKNKDKSKDNSDNNNVSKSSKHSYEFDFDSDVKKTSALKSGRHSRGKKVTLKNTSKKEKYVVEDEVFTIERNPKEMEEEIHTLKEDMKNFENQVISMVRNLKIDMENRDKLTEERIKMVKDPDGDYQDVRNNLEYLKKLTEALEEERKKDMLRSKQFIEEKAGDLYNDIKMSRTQEMKEVDKKLEQTKFEVVEQLIELTNNHKRETRETKYEIDKNREDLNVLANNLKNPRRRNNEDNVKEEVRVLQKSDSQISTSITQKVEDQIDQKLRTMKQEIQRNNEHYVEENINLNNQNFVIPNIERQKEQKSMTFSEQNQHLNSNTNCPQGIIFGSEREFEER